MSAAGTAAFRQAALVWERWPRVQLSIELIPATSSFRNLRFVLPAAHWDRIRTAVYREAHYRCEICGDRGSRHPVECHEEWLYDEALEVQKLARLVALCPDCHAVKHYGRALANYIAEPAFRHLCGVNRWDGGTADRYLEDVFRLWELRSAIHWTLDLALVFPSGANPNPQPVDSHRRPGA